MSGKLETIAEKAVEWTLTAIIGGLAGAAIAIRPSLASSMELIIPLILLAFIMALLTVGVFNLFTKSEIDEIKELIDELNEKIEESNSENENENEKSM